MDLSELLKDAQKRGYTRNFAIDLDQARRDPDAGDFEARGARIVEANAADEGTDPGDDATVFLIETMGGARGYLILSDSFHADPYKAAFVDGLRNRAEPASNEE